MILSTRDVAARNALMTLGLLLPWLNPFAAGPSPAVMPWLVTLASVATLLLITTIFASIDVSARREGFAECWAYPVAWAWLLAGVISSLMGLLQYFGVAAAFDPWINQTLAGEAFANLRQRNQFATLTNMALAALVWMVSKNALSAPGQVTRGPASHSWLALAACSVLVMGNAASSSRTGLMQLALLCAVFGLWGAWRQPAVRNILLTAVVVYALATLLLPVAGGFDLTTHGMMARLRAGDPPCASRITLWANVLHLISLKLWLGWGWGELDYAHYITLYDGPRFCEILDNAHNLPLQLAVELGLPMATVLCGGFAFWVIGQKPWRECNPDRQLAWAILALILLHSMLEYPLWYGPFQVAAALCAGLLWRSKTSLKIPKNKSNTDLVHVTRLFIAIILIAFCIFAIRDYKRISEIYLAPEARDPAYRSDTLGKIRDSWLFENQVRFAELVLSPLTPENAQSTYDNASRLLHYSPEPRVVEKAIESASLLGKDNEAAAHLARFKAAFPLDHARWVLANAKAP